MKYTIDLSQLTCTFLIFLVLVGQGAFAMLHPIGDSSSSSSASSSSSSQTHPASSVVGLPPLPLTTRQPLISLTAPSITSPHSNLQPIPENPPAFGTLPLSPLPTTGTDEQGSNNGDNPVSQANKRRRRAHRAPNQTRSSFDAIPIPNQPVTAHPIDVPIQPDLSSAALQNPQAAAGKSELLPSHKRKATSRKSAKASNSDSTFYSYPLVSSSSSSSSTSPTVPNSPEVLNPLEAINLLRQALSSAFSPEEAFSATGPFVTSNERDPWRRHCHREEIEGLRKATHRLSPSVDSSDGLLSATSSSSSSSSSLPLLSVKTLFRSLAMHINNYLQIGVLTPELHSPLMVSFKELEHLISVPPPFSSTTTLLETFLSKVRLSFLSSLQQAFNLLGDSLDTVDLSQYESMERLFSALRPIGSMIEPIRKTSAEMRRDPNAEISKIKNYLTAAKNLFQQMNNNEDAPAPSIALSVSSSSSEEIKKLVSVSLAQWIWDEALRQAAAEGYFKMVCILLKKPALDPLSPQLNSAFFPHVYAPNLDGQTALTLAAQNAHFPIVKYILNSEEESEEVVNPKKILLSSALSVALESNNENMAALLAQAADVDLREKTILFLSPFHNNSKMIKLLVKSGVTLSTPNQWAYETIMLIVHYRDAIELINFLLDSGVPVETKDEEGSTLLIGAAQYCPDKIIALLLSRGANTMAVNDRGITPLIAYFHSDAAAMGELSLKIIHELLVNKGADANASDEDENTALTLFAKNPGMAKKGELEAIGTLLFRYSSQENIQKARQIAQKNMQKRPYPSDKKFWELLQKLQPEGL